MSVLVPPAMSISQCWHSLLCTALDAGTTVCSGSLCHAPGPLNRAGGHPCCGQGVLEKRPGCVWGMRSCPYHVRSCTHTLMCAMHTPGHAPRWGLCSTHRPHRPLGGLGLTEISQGTVAQPSCGALRLLLHHALRGVGETGT